MSIPTSLTAFIASLQAFREVASGTIKDRVAVLQIRLKYLEDRRGDDIDALALQAQRRREQVVKGRDDLLKEIERQATGRLTQIDAEEAIEMKIFQGRFEQDCEAIEQQIETLETLNRTIIHGLVEQQPTPNFAAGLDDSLTGAGDTVTMKWADGTTSAIDPGILSEETKAMPQVADSPVVLDDVHVRPRDPKDAFDTSRLAELSATIGQRGFVVSTEDYGLLVFVRPGSAVKMFEYEKADSVVLPNGRVTKNRGGDKKGKLYDGGIAPPWPFSGSADPKAGDPIWRNKKPITEWTDAELDAAIPSERPTPFEMEARPEIREVLVERERRFQHGITVTVTEIPQPEGERMVPRFKPSPEDEPHDRFNTVDGKNATPKPKPLPIPAGIYYSVIDDNFYNAITHKGKGNDFYSIWRNRSEDFPRDPRISRSASGQAGEAD